MYCNSFSRVTKWFYCAPVGGMRIWPLLLDLSFLWNVRSLSSPTPLLSACCLSYNRSFMSWVDGYIWLMQTASVPLCKVHCKYWQGDSKRRTTTLSEKGRKRARLRVWWVDGGEVLPPPKATECALMRCGREHTVSPESEREQPHTHQSFCFTATLLFQNVRTCTHTHTRIHAHSHYAHPYTS